ncbi:MAG: hypothetical protein Q8K12_06030 [Thiobacillus sp.]|nr:hypothetical protein [Thiobacillus sp.]
MKRRKKEHPFLSMTGKGVFIHPKGRGSVVVLFAKCANKWGISGRIVVSND